MTPELSVGVAAVALAWKSAIQFGGLLMKILADDSRHQTVLLLTLKTSEFSLDDWNSHWGVNRDDGRFHALEPARKKLIESIIYALRDSRSAALGRLEDRYKIATERGDCDGRDRGSTKKTKGKRFRKAVDHAITGLETAKNKTWWLVHDQDVITQLVKDTKELNECLQCLTYGSRQFVRDVLPNGYAASSRGAKVAYMVQRGKEVAQSTRRRLDNGGSSSVEHQDDEAESDKQTAISCAAKSIITTAQSARFRQHLDRALNFRGDARIPEAIRTWWDDEKSGVLVLETPDSAEDESSTLICALVHYLCPGQKITYSFDRETRADAATAFLGMAQDLIRSIVSLRIDMAFSNDPLPPEYNLADLGRKAADMEGIGWTVNVLHHLLRFLVSNCNERITITIDGVDTVSVDEGGHPMPYVQAFLRGVHAICADQAESGMGNGLKVLVGCKGHVSALTACVGDQDAVDLTSYAARRTSIMVELAMFY